MSHSLVIDGPGVTAPLPTKIAPLTGVWKLGNRKGGGQNVLCDFFEEGNVL